jgi:hypothetical protein
MGIRRTASRSVNPGVAAVLIVAVLGAVQYVWWQKLVAKHPGPHGPGQMQGGPRGGALIGTVQGLPTVRVTTLAGDQEPGSSDGPGHAARFDGPSAVAVAPSGDVYVADTRNHRIRVVRPDGQTTTLTGLIAGFRDGTLAEAQFDSPSGVAVGPDGAIYVADTNNHRIRRIAAGVVSTVCGGGAGFADGPAPVARFSYPTSLAVDAANPPSVSLVVADSGNRRVRVVTLGSPSAQVRTLRTLPGVPTAVSMAGAQVVDVQTNPSAVDLGVSRLTDLPVDLKDLDGSFRPGSIVVRDPAGAASDRGVLFLTDGYHGAIFRVQKGVAEVVAGASRTQDRLIGLRDGTGDKAKVGPGAMLTPDGKGNLYFADTANNAVRKLSLESISASLP